MSYDTSIGESGKNRKGSSNNSLRRGIARQFVRNRVGDPNADGPVSGADFLRVGPWTRPIGPCAASGTSLERLMGTDFIL